MYTHYIYIMYIIYIYIYTWYMPENQHLIFSPTHLSIPVQKSMVNSFSPASSQGQDCLRSRLPGGHLFFGVQWIVNHDINH